MKPDDAQYAYLNGLQQLGATETAEVALLRQQKLPVTIPGDCTDMGCWGDFSVSVPAFTYTPADRLADYCSSGTTCTRVQGGIMLAGGGAGMAAAISAGSATCVQTAGGGCALAIVAGATSADYAGTGFVQLITGRTTVPMGEQVLQSLGLDPQQAALLYAAVNLGSGTAAGVLARAATSSLAKLDALFAADVFDGPSVTMAAGRNTGVEAEVAVNQYLSEKLGVEFKSLQNNSGNGGDGIAIDPATRTIYVAEAKSSTGGVAAADTAQGDPATKLDKWVQLATGDSPTPATWKALPAEARALAEQVQIAVSKQYAIKGIQVQVGVPAPGSSGTSQLKVSPWQ